MAIAEQFAGLDMEQLIGAPLSAAADASKQLADSTADFINRVGFGSDGKVRTVAFGYQKHSVNEDGTSNLDEMKVDVPMLAIVPIPNLQVDEVNILFDMEVKQSEKSESSTDMSGSVSGGLNLGIFRVKVTGNVSSHSSNTRSSDNSAKYHVDVRATNHGIPEGLARVLDMMAANVAPVLVDSSIKDGNGQSLSETARIKAEQLKALRQEIAQAEKRLGAANDSLSNNISLLKKMATSQFNVYQTQLTQKINGLSEDDTEKDAAYGQIMDELSQSWNGFLNQAADLIGLIADNAEEPATVSEMFGLKALGIDSENGNELQLVSYKEEEDEGYYSAILSAQKSALKAQRTVNQLEKELYDVKSKYSDTMAGKAENNVADAGKPTGQSQAQTPEDNE